ncbi:MAG TPA: EAL domain-containing protein [Chloroflexota bacterium]|nr:EAL domain-containing protein [Chloroflexota bacterium]
MRLQSVRTGIAATLGVLTLGLCFVGGLAVDASVRAAQQAATFQVKSVVPVVRLSSVMQSIDQERDLLDQDMAHLPADRRSALWAEMGALDRTVASTASQSLPPDAYRQWSTTWQEFLGQRARYEASLQTGKTPSLSAREQLSDRLDRSLDLVEQYAGVHLYQGQRLYSHAVAQDWLVIRITAFGVLLTILLGLVVGALVVRRLTRGLRNLSAAANEITNGNLEVRAGTEGNDELTAVARAFNHMTDALLAMERTALTDPLTGLGNHRAFQEELQRECARAVRHGHALSLALVDADDFKLLNDSRGHATGDQALSTLAACMRETRTGDRHFRVGGDEFAILLPYATGAEAEQVVERLRGRVEGSVHGLTISCGVADLSDGVRDAETLREQADAALYEAKRRGRNRVSLFEAIRGHAVIISPEKIQAVRQILSDRSVIPVFQPIWGLDEGTVLGYEALMRPPADLAIVNPQEVFDIAEKLGRAAELDSICLHAILQRAREIPPQALLFVNLSPQSLDYGSLRAGPLMTMVEEAGLEPRRLVFEITERSVARVDTVVREAKRLRELGFNLALDDVGAGNAGLDMLRQVAVDFVKIDRSVITAALVDDSAAAVLSGIVAFARHARTYVIAEGIETPAMLEMIRSVSVADPALPLGVQAVQGYLLGRPSPEIAPPPAPDIGSLLDERMIDERRAAS